MPAAHKRITSDDITPIAEYGKKRAARRAALLPVKKLRRVEVGPFACFYFENFDSMLAQVQEMLYIEKGGAAQLEDELAAYNPLIPQGDELVATLMFEITDAVRRTEILRTLGSVENHIFIELDGERIAAIPEDDAERTTPDGKTSSVHFVRFKFTPEQITAFKKENAKVMLGFDHENYSHLAAISPASRQALAEDFN